MLRQQELHLYIYNLTQCEGTSPPPARGTLAGEGAPPKGTYREDWYIYGNVLITCPVFLPCFQLSTLFPSSPSAFLSIFHYYTTPGLARSRRLRKIILAILPDYTEHTMPDPSSTFALVFSMAGS